MKLDFRSTKDGDRPQYGEPVLIVSNGVLQNITYILDGADDVQDWFEPYFFDHKGSLKIWWHKVDEWAYLKDASD